MFCVHTQSCLFATSWTVAHQALLSMGFPRQKLEWVAISFSRRSSWARGWIRITCISWISQWILYHFTTWELANYTFSSVKSFLISLIHFPIQLPYVSSLVALGLCRCVRAFSSCSGRGWSSLRGARASHCVCSAQALGARVSVVVAPGSAVSADWF